MNIDIKFMKSISYFWLNSVIICLIAVLFERPRVNIRSNPKFKMLVSVGTAITGSRSTFILYFSVYDANFDSISLLNLSNFIYLYMTVLFVSSPISYLEYI